jgi:hypothetical protein
MKETMNKEKAFMQWLKETFPYWAVMSEGEMEGLYSAWKAGKEYGYNLAERSVGRRGEGG